MKLSLVEKNNFHYPPIAFNNLPVKRVQFHKHLQLTLDSKLNFHEHISTILSKANKLSAVHRNYNLFYLGIPVTSLQGLYKTSFRLL